MEGSLITDRIPRFSKDEQGWFIAPSEHCKTLDRQAFPSIYDLVDYYRVSIRVGLHVRDQGCAKFDGLSIHNAPLPVRNSEGALRKALIGIADPSLAPDG